MKGLSSLSLRTRRLLMVGGVLLLLAVVAAVGLVASGQLDSMGLAGTAAAGCNNSLSPSNPTMTFGSAQQLTTNSTNCMIHQDSARYSSSNTNVAIISGRTVYAIGAGTATIQSEYGGHYATTTVTVPAPTGPAVMMYFPNPTVSRSKTYKLTLRQTDQTSNNQDVTATATWTSSNPAVATVNQGLVTAIASGTTTITGSNGGKSTSTVVKVKSVTSLALSPANPTFDQYPRDLSAVATYDDGSTEDVRAAASWTSSNTAIATVSGGTVRGVSNGQATITATYVLPYQTFTASTTVTISLAVWSVSPNNPVVKINGSQQLTMMLNGSPFGDQNVTAWSSSNPAVASISGRTVTGVSVGTATITGDYGGNRATTTVTVVIDPNLAAYWKLDEGSGATANDASGYGKHATLSTPGPAWATDHAPAPLGNNFAYQSQMIGGYTLNAPLATTQVDNVTLAAWVKFNNVTNGNRIILMNGHSGNSGYGLILYGSPSTIQLIVAGRALYNFGYVPPVNVWQHVALVRASGTWRLYIDGVQKGGTSTQAPATPTQGTYIGSNGIHENLGGLLDEVRIYTKALSATELRELAGVVLPTSSTGCYYIKSQQTGFMLDVAGANIAAGTSVVVWPQKSPAAKNQLWQITADGYIKSRLNGYVLTTQGNSVDQGMSLVVETIATPANPTQRWTILGDGYIRNRGTGFVVDVAGASTTQGAWTDAWPQVTPAAPNQLWTLVASSTCG